MLRESTQRLLSKDLVSSVSVGKVDDKMVVDLNYEEEAYDAEVTDLPVAMIPRTNQITLLQMNGSLSREDIKKGLEMASKALKKIYDIQKKALRDRYKGESL